MFLGYIKSPVRPVCMVFGIFTSTYENMCYEC